MLITGTSSIVGVLTIEVRDPFQRAYQSYSIRSGITLRVPDDIRFSPAVTDATTRGLITLTQEDDDDASQDDVTSAPSSSGFTAVNVGLSVAVTSDSYVEVYDSGAGDFSNMDVSFRNTGLNPVDVQARVTEPIEGVENTQQTKSNQAAGAYNGMDVGSDWNYAMTRLRIFAKRTNAGQSSTINLQVRGISFD